MIHMLLDKSNIKYKMETNGRMIFFLDHFSPTRQGSFEDLQRIDEDLQRNVADRINGQINFDVFLSLYSWP